MNVVPLTEGGEDLGENADLIDDPNELLGKRIDFAIEIDNADLPANFCQDTFCRYVFLNDNHEFETFNTVSVSLK